MTTQNAWYQRLPLTRQINQKILTEKVRRRARIGLGHWQTSFEMIPDSMPYKAPLLGYCKTFDIWEAQGVGVILLGEHGKGKTSLGSLVLKWCLAKGGRSLSYRYNDLVDRLMSFKPQFAPNGAPLGIALRSVNCLLIDDFEIDKGVRLQKIESVLRSRYDECLPTIITTNQSRKQLFEILWLKDILNSYAAFDVDGIDWRKRPPDTTSTSIL